MARRPRPVGDRASAARTSRAETRRRICLLEGASELPILGHDGEVQQRPGRSGDRDAGATS